MLFHFDRRKKSEKEKKPPRFLVLRRKWLTLGAAVLAALLADRRLLRRVDYSLLLTFLFFFVFVGNMINENCHLSSKVEIMVSICLIAQYKYSNRL